MTSSSTSTASPAATSRVRSPLRVGIIGASARGGWARESHVPAVQGLPGLELAAVAGSSQASADAAATAFGAARAYGSADDLVADPDVDVVTVAIKVPGHRSLVLGALAAGKHVYCEWPLGRTAAETQELSRARHEAGVRAVIGLQASASPAAHRARDLVSAGAVGRVLSARLYDGTAAFGPVIGEADRYLEDAANGATLYTIHAGHCLDVALTVLGSGLDDPAMLGSIQHPLVRVGDDGEQLHRRVPDHLLVLGHAPGGAPLSVEVAGGRPPGGALFSFEVVGEHGVLTLRGGELRGFQAGRLRLEVDGIEHAVDEGDAAGLPDAAANVAAIYAALRDDVAERTATAPGFDRAVELAELLETIAQNNSRSQAGEPRGGR